MRKFLKENCGCQGESEEEGEAILDEVSKIKGKKKLLLSNEFKK